MIDLSIKVKWSKTANDDIRAALAKPMALATAAAQHMQARLMQGRFATPPDAFSSTPHAGPKDKPRFYVSPAYATKTGLGNQTRFASSAEMHQSRGFKPANASGEMLRGIQVRNFGAEGAVIDFQGSSTGASSTLSAITKKTAGTFEISLSGNGKLRAKQVRELSRDEGGKVKYRRKPKMVSNATKASTVFKNLNIGLLQNTDDELIALANALAAHTAVATARALGGTAENLPHAGDPRLYAVAYRELKK